MMPDSQHAVERQGTISIWGKASLVLSAVFLTIGVFSIGLVLPTLKHALAGSPQAALIPWIASIVGPAFALGSPLMGFIVEKFGYRSVYIISIIVFVASGVAPMFLDNLWLVLVLRIILGVSVAGALTAAGDGIGRLPSEQHPMLFGAQVVAGSLAGVGMYPIIGVLAESGWHMPFTVHLVGLLVLPLAFTLPRHIQSAAAKTDASPETASPKNPLAGLSLAVCLLGATIGLVSYTNSIFSPVYLGSIGILNPASASIPITVSAMGVLVMSTAYGFIHRILGTNSSFAVALLSVAIGFAFCSVATSLLGFTLSIVLVGFGLGIWQPNIYTWALQKSDAPPGRVLGFVNGAIYLAPIFFPLLAPIVIAHDGPGSIFALLAAITAIWACWFGLLSRRRKIDNFTA
jgi:MFS family permease